MKKNILGTRCTTLSVRQKPLKKNVQQSNPTQISCSDTKNSSNLIIRLKISREVVAKVLPAKPINKKAGLSEKQILMGNKCREYVCENIRKYLVKAVEEIGSGGCKVDELPISIESNLFKEWGLCNGPNKLKYLSLLTNLRDEKNQDFRRKVVQGIFTPQQISTLTPRDMASEARIFEDQKILDSRMNQSVTIASSRS